MEARTSNPLHHLQMQLSMMNSGRMLENTISFDGTSSKRRATENCDDESAWPGLPDDLMDRVSSLLRIPDYLNLGRVCPEWRLYFLASNKEFATSLPPLVCYISAWDQNTCTFDDISNGQRYQARLPYFADKFSIGLSCGHIIMGQLFSTFWFINPATGYQHVFSNLPLQKYCMDQNDRFIFASTGPDKNILLVVLSRTHHYIWFRRSIDTHWSAYSFGKKAWILDMVVFNGRVFVINTHYQIGILSLRYANVRFLNLTRSMSNPIQSSTVRFVTSNDQLFVVDFVPFLWLKIYQIDFSTMAWVTVDDLGEQALFLGEKMGIGISNTTGWGGRGNCVYYLPFGCKKVYIYSCDGDFLSSIPVIGGDRAASDRVKSWYFFDQSYNLDYVRDE